MTWHEGGRACLCFGSKEEVARRKKGGDVTGLLKLFSWFPDAALLECPWFRVEIQQRRCLKSTASSISRVTSAIKSDRSGFPAV